MDQMINGHLAGDVVLVRGVGKVSDLIVAMQRAAVREYAANYSHVILSIAPGVFIHSNKDGGVHIASLSSVIDSKDYKDNWRVLRNLEIQRRIGGDPSYAFEILRKAIYYLRQDYNIWFGIPKGTSKKPGMHSGKNTFCSELIAKVYRDLGIPLFQNMPEKTFPVHIEMLIHSSSWIDVTHVYNSQVPDEQKEILISIITRNASEFQKKTGLSLEEQLKLAETLSCNDIYDSSAEVSGRLFELLQRSQKDQVIIAQSLDMLTKLLTDLGCKDEADRIRQMMPHTLDQLIKFWDVPKRNV